MPKFAVSSVLVLTTICSVPAWNLAQVDEGVTKECGWGGGGGGVSVPERLNPRYAAAFHPTLAISACPSGAMAPSTYRYSTLGGIPPYRWTAGGSGVTVGGEGNKPVTDVIVSPGACGSFTVSVVDSAGTPASRECRTNSGSWVPDGQCGSINNGDLRYFTSGSRLYRASPYRILKGCENPPCSCDDVPQICPPITSDEGKVYFDWCDNYCPASYKYGKTAGYEIQKWVCP